MYNDKVVFSGGTLIGANQGGTLKKNEHGYYEVVLGALDVFNSNGQYYPLGPAKALFEASSAFMRRLKNKALRAEYGHPKRDGMPLMEYADRLTRIDERMVCCHIHDVWLETSKVKNAEGRTVIAIMGLICPTGPYGEVLRQQLENPNENVCFSIRAVTHDEYVRGRYEKQIREIISWDYVNEPGISVANKFSSPSLESIDTVVPLELMGTYLSAKRPELVAMEAAGDVTLAGIYEKAKSSIMLPSRTAGSQSW
jgi:hypothetical protein|nr:MAG: Prohead core protein serine protease [Bacteriophage sp.]